jgi:hypothetical protein
MRGGDIGDGRKSLHRDRRGRRVRREEKAVKEFKSVRVKEFKSAVGISVGRVMEGLTP